MGFISEAKYMSSFMEIFSLGNNANGAARAKDIMSHLKALVQDSKLDVTRAYTNMPEERKKLENSVKSTYPNELNMVTPETRKKRLRVVHSFLCMVHRKRRKSYLSRCSKQRQKEIKNATASGANEKGSNGSASCSSEKHGRVYTGRHQLYVLVPPPQKKQRTKSSTEGGQSVSVLINKKRTEAFNEVLDSPTTVGNTGNSIGLSSRTKFRRTPYPSSSRADRIHEQLRTPSAPAFTENAIFPEASSSMKALGSASALSIAREITARPCSSLGMTPSRPYYFQTSSTTHTEHSVPPTNLQEMAELRHFLSTCEPPLSKYLPQFVAVGCRNKQYLRAVSKLPEHVLKEFIESLENGDEERRMTVTEKFVLRAWFGKYFQGM